MSRCRRCTNCVHCDVVRFYSFDAARVFMLRVFLKLLLWKQREVAELRELCKGVTQFLAFYPERRKLVFYVMRYKVILWLSVDEAGSHAV